MLVEVHKNDACYSGTCIYCDRVASNCSCSVAVSMRCEQLPTWHPGPIAILREMIDDDVTKSS